MMIEISIWGILTIIAVELMACWIIFLWGKHYAHLSRGYGNVIEKNKKALAEQERQSEEKIDALRRAHSRAKVEWDTERYRLEQEVRRNSLSPEEYKHLCERLRLMHGEYTRQMKQVKYKGYFQALGNVEGGEGSPPPEPPAKTEEVPYQFKLAQFLYNPYTGEKL